MDIDALRKLYSETFDCVWDEVEGIKWIRENWNALDLDLKTTFYARYLTNNIFLDLPSKTTLLIQRPCLICNPELPWSILSFSISPESWQSLASVSKAAFKRAIKHRIDESPHLLKYMGRICLTIFYVCSSSRRVRDLDNMTKLFVDSIKEHVIPDDREIDHLSIARIDHSGDFEYILVRIANSRINSMENVLDATSYNPLSAWSELKLEDFIQPTLTRIEDILNEAEAAP